jgi:hypothetical protein
VELPAEVREGITWHPVRTMDEVLALALRPAAPVAAMTQPTAEPARGRARGGRATPPILPPEPPPERVGVTPTRSRRPAAAERA